MSDTDTKPGLPDLVGNQPPALKEILAKYGVIPANIGKSPDVVVVGKVNLDELCTLTTPVYDQKQNVIRCEGHTGPMMFLASQERTPETVKDMKSKYDDYIGFHIFTVYHPDRGETVITHGIPKDGPTEVSLHIAKLEPGNLLHVAAFKTSSGNRLFKPIHPQGPNV